MKYVFDIDGTICTSTDGSYELAKPIKGRIDKINKLYDEENEIIFFTARGMGRTKNNIHLAYSYFYDLTMKQLREWGVKYHQLFLGKPAGDIYVDDKAARDKDFFGD
jgi:histidinol phosphatase-like enzyme